jgi:hypothetical protein
MEICGPGDDYFGKVKREIENKIVTRAATKN